MTNTSTINRNNPPANTPVASNVVRGNFNAAANDIDALWDALGGIVSGVSSFNGRTGDVSLINSDVVSALGFNPHTKMGNLHWISPANTSIPISLVPYSEYAFTIVRLNNLSVSVGSLTLGIQINGVPVAGLDGLSVTSFSQNPSASSANLVNVGDEVTMTISGSASPLNLKFSMLATL